MVRKIDYVITNCLIDKMGGARLHDAVGLTVAILDAIENAGFEIVEKNGRIHPIDEIAGRIRLEELCGACPESYDAKIDGVQVGYLRLRNGIFRVECPDSGGTEVYQANPIGDGIFDHDERAEYLDKAKRSIAIWLQKTKHPAASRP